jgi:Na+/H+ antiporter NhaD/arsenite permease-like protein
MEALYFALGVAGLFFAFIFSVDLFYRRRLPPPPDHEKTQGLSVRRRYRLNVPQEIALWVLGLVLVLMLLNSYFESRPLQPEPVAALLVFGALALFSLRNRKWAKKDTQPGSSPPNV